MRLAVIVVFLFIASTAEAQQRAMPGQAGWVNSGAKFGYCWTFRQNQCGGGPAAWSRQAGSCVCVGGGRRGMAAR
jgi:hypothetical protein